MAYYQLGTHPGVHPALPAPPCRSGAPLTVLGVLVGGPLGL